LLSNGTLDPFQIEKGRQVNGSLELIPMFLDVTKSERAEGLQADDAF